MFVDTPITQDPATISGRFCAIDEFSWYHSRSRNLVTLSVMNKNSVANKKWRKTSTKFQMRKIEAKIATATTQINMFTNTLLSPGAFITPRKRKDREKGILQWANKLLSLSEEEKRLLSGGKVERATISDSNDHDFDGFNDGQAPFSGDIDNERFIFGMKPFHALDCHTITVLHCLLGIKVCSDLLLSVFYFIN